MNRMLIAFLSLPLLTAAGPDKPDAGPPPAPDEAASYAFVRGDTLYSLARWAQTSLPTLLAANPGIDPRKIEIGDSVRLPAGAADPDEMRAHERGVVRIRADIQFGPPRREMQPAPPPRAGKPDDVDDPRRGPTGM